jgi:hypothetical protein
MFAIYYLVNMVMRFSYNIVLLSGIPVSIFRSIYPCKVFKTNVTVLFDIPNYFYEEEGILMVLNKKKILVFLHLSYFFRDERKGKQFWPQSCIIEFFVITFIVFGKLIWQNVKSALLSLIHYIACSALLFCLTSLNGRFLILSLAYRHGLYNLPYRSFKTKWHQPDVSYFN